MTACSSLRALLDSRITSFDAGSSSGLGKSGGCATAMELSGGADGPCARAIVVSPSPKTIHVLAASAFRPKETNLVDSGLESLHELGWTSS
jgi:hypothetical protein